jgi:hypothetical protein
MSDVKMRRVCCTEKQTNKEILVSSTTSTIFIDIKRKREREKKREALRKRE